MYYLKWVFFIEIVGFGHAIGAVNFNMRGFSEYLTL